MPHKKTYLTLEVQTKTALHVGTYQQGDDVSDSLFRRDIQGRLVLPGTGIAGAIRGHLTRITPAMTALSPKHLCDALIGAEKTENDSPIACSCIICHLMGDIRPLNEIRNTEDIEELERLNGRASRLIIHDALIDMTKTHIRDGVGIDRVTGAAARAASAKFDFETIPAGTAFTVHLELEDSNEVDEYLLNLMLHEWKKDRIRFGGNKSRGTGVLSLKKVTYKHFDLSGRQHLMAFLRRPTTVQASDDYDIKPPQRLYHKTYQEQANSVQSWITLSFELHASGFFLTNDTTDALVNGHDHHSMTFLTGASLRGAMRSQAERIARTLVNLDVNDADEFLRRCPAPNPFIAHTQQDGIMSSSARIQEIDPEKRFDSDAYDLSEQLFGSVDWGSRLLVEDTELINQAQWKKLDFVAIDRFTGGGADGAKFDAYALWQPRFKCQIMLESPRGWEIGWLLYVLQDMHDGLVTVGYGAAKGFGDVRLRNPQMTVGYAYPEVIPHLDLPQPNTFFGEHPLTTWESINRQKWRKAWIDKLATFEVAIPHRKLQSDGTYLALSLDPYWQTNVSTIYNKETDLNAYPS